MPDNVIGGGELLAHQMRGRMRSVYLTGSEDAPPYAVLEIYGRAWNGSLLVRKPSRDDIPAQYLIFNTDAWITANSFGAASNTWPVVSRYDNGLPLTNREEIGTVGGQWHLSKGYLGVLGVGQISADSEYAVVLPSVDCRERGPGGYGYYYGQPNLPCYCCGCRQFGNPTQAANFPASMEVTVQFPCLGTRTLTVDADYVNGCRHAIDGTPGTLGYQPGWGLDGSYFESDEDEHSISGQYCDEETPFIEIGPYFESLEILIYCICSTTGNTEDFYRYGCIPAPGGTNMEPVGHWMAAIRWSKASVAGFADVTAVVPMEIVTCSPFALTGSATSTCDPGPYLGHCPSENIAWPCQTCCRSANDACVGGLLQVDADA